VKKTILILSVELLISAIFAFGLNNAVINYNFFTALGLGNLIIGVVGALIGLIIVNTSEKRDRSFLLASGLLLLIGCLVCSFFPLQLNNPHN